MQTASPLHSPLRRRLLLGIGGVGAAFFFYVLGNSWWQEHQLRQEIAGLRAAGIPTTAEELNDFYAIPFGTPEATADWMKPINALSSGAIGRHPHGFTVLDEIDSLPPHPGKDWPNLGRAEQFINDHQPLFIDIDAAVANPGLCCFIRDFSPGVNLLLPHAQETRTITRLLALRAFVSAHQGDSAATLDDINAMLTTANALAREPVMVTQLCRNANVRLALLALEELLPFLLDSTVDLEKTQHRLATINFHDCLKIFVLGDRALGLISFDNPATAGAGNVPPVFYRGWVRDHPLKLLAAMRELDEVFDEDWPAPLSIAKPFSNKAWQESQVRSPWGNKTWHAPTKFAKAIAAYIIPVANDEARARATVAGLAAVRYRRQQNRWPSSLEDLVPDYLTQVPSDPFTAEPLKFVASETEIRIYSVGANLKDDRGVEIIEAEEQGSYRQGNPDVLCHIPLLPIVTE